MVLVDDCSTQEEGVQFCIKHYNTYISLSMVARMCKVTEEIKKIGTYLVTTCSKFTTAKER